MNYGELEEAIVTRLAPLAQAGHEVVSQPENQNDFKRTVNGARVTVGYVGSEFAKVSSTAQIRQEETPKFEVAIQARKLRGNGGLYSVIEAIRTLLIGFRPPHCERMRVMEIGLVDYVDSVFTYSIVFGATSLAVEQFAAEDAVLIRKITIDSNPDNPGAVVAPPPNTFPPNPPSARIGDLSYWNGEVWVRLAPGTAGHVLHTAGIGQAPYWDAGATETDPVFTQWLNGNPFAGYATQSYVGAQLGNYYTKSQSDSRYLQSFAESDPTVQSHIKGITTTNISNWNSAFGWGNHASAGYALASALSSYVPTTRTLTINGQSFDLTADRSWTVTGAPGGNNGQVQYNNAGSLAGTGAFLFNGTQVGIGVGQVAATRLTVAGINADTSANFVARFTNIAGTSDYLVVRGDGSIGVGTNSPNGNFVVFRSGSSVASVKFQNGVSGSLTSEGLEMGVDASGLGYVGTLHNANLRFVTNMADRFIIDNVGRGFFNGNFSFGGSGIMPPTTVDIRRQGASLQLYSTTNSGDTDFYMSGNSSGGVNRYGLLRFIANNFSNGGLYYLPNTLTTTSASFVLTGTGNTLFGTTTDNPRALVNMVATNKGMLIPRLSTTQRNAVSWAVGDAGMIIYNTTDNVFQGWNGTTWNNL